tara:strand:+ start:54871 stop:55467 length:597 start_codon:yes stop_codon:yes gene_type:complete
MVMTNLYKCIPKILLALATLISIQVYAKDVNIFDVRKTLPLSETEKVYQDFYVNGGSERGLKPGMLVTVTRRLNPYDTYQNKSPGELNVAVGRLKIIHVQEGVSVARLHSLYSRSSRPVLEYDYLMVGDKLDLNTLQMDRGRKKSVSQAIPQPEETTPVADTVMPAEAPADQKEESKEMSSVLRKLPGLDDLVIEQRL